MKKVLFALVGLLLATSAFAQYGGSSNYGPQYTWPKDNFLSGMMGPAGATLNPLSIGPKPSTFSAPFTLTGSAPFNNQFVLTQTNNGFDQSSYAMATSGPLTAGGWTFGNLSDWNLYLCGKFKSGTGNIDCTNETTVAPSGRSFARFGNSGNPGDPYWGREVYYKNGPGTLTSQIIESAHTVPYPYWDFRATRTQTPVSYAFEMHGEIGKLWFRANYGTGSNRFTRLDLDGTLDTAQLWAGYNSSIYSYLRLDANNASGLYAYNGVSISTADLNDVSVGIARANIVTDNFSVRYGANLLYDGTGYTIDDRFQYYDVSNYTSADDNLKITVTDTTPSIVGGYVSVCGQLAKYTGQTQGTFACEAINIGAGAGVYTTVNQYASVLSSFWSPFRTSDMTVLGGAGDEKIAAEWANGTGWIGSINIDYNNMADGDTVLVSDGSTPITYTFRTVVANDFDVKIGADEDESGAHFYCALMDAGCTEGAGQDFMASAAMPNVTVTDLTGGLVTVESTTDGPDQLGYQIVYTPIGTPGASVWTIDGKGGKVLATTDLTDFPVMVVGDSVLAANGNFVPLMCLDAHIGCEWSPGLPMGGTSNFGAYDVVFTLSLYGGPVVVQDGGKAYLAGDADCTLGQNDTLHMVWHGGQGSNGRWIEVSRSDN